MLLWLWLCLLLLLLLFLLLRQQRGWSTAMRSQKGQILLHEVLLNALPQLPTDFEEKMMVGFALMDRFLP